MNLIVLFFICRITVSINVLKGEKAAVAILSESGVMANVLKIINKNSLTKKESIIKISLQKIKIKINIKTKKMAI